MVEISSNEILNVIRNIGGRFPNFCQKNHSSSWFKRDSKNIKFYTSHDGLSGDKSSKSSGTTLVELAITIPFLFGRLVKRKKGGECPLKRTNLHGLEYILGVE